MGTGRKPWEEPIVYNEDRFPEKRRESSPLAAGERSKEEVEELLRRPSRSLDDKHYKCTDTTPINYSRGPHDQEFGVDDRDDRLPGTYVPGRVEEGDPGDVDYDDGELEAADAEDHIDLNDGPQDS